MERFYSPESPDPPPELHQAFVGYFDGIIVGDPDNVLYATRCMERHDTPFHEQIRICADYLEFIYSSRADCSCNQSRRSPGAMNPEWSDHANAPIIDTKTSRILAEWGLRAYTYSGLAVRFDLMRIVADRFRLNDRTLREYILPREPIVTDIIEAIDRSNDIDYEKDLIRWHGLRVLHELNADYPTDRMRLARVNRRIANQHGKE